MDPSYHRHLKYLGEPSHLASAPSCALILSTADAVISDHGLHSIALLLVCSNLKFFDVWHGIPFKGFDADAFPLQHRYTETWVASPLMRDLYVRRFGFPPDTVVVTGYARTDQLAIRTESRYELLRRLGLTDYANERLVLFAPTWEQETRSRSPFPFGTDPKEFLGRLEPICREYGARFLFRAHLNERTTVNPAEHGIVPISSGDEPDTEALLQVSDVLICDWSSIAFDFLVLQRPTIFLDVPCPFAKGFSLGPEYRFGRIVADQKTTQMALEEALAALRNRRESTPARGNELLETIYGGYADGRSAERCVHRLYAHLTDPESSPRQPSLI